MFTEGIFPIGDGLLDINEERLKELLVPDDINEIYELEQTPFARGKFAAVRRAVHKNSGVHYAAKFLKRRRRAQSSDKEIKHEIAVLKLCDGAENIVKLNAVHESRSDTALLLELATGGELQTFLDNEECLSEAHARYCMREVLKALQFLHKRSIAHLDLKPQNILLTGERIEDGLKLCDFGISRVVAEGTNVREIVGTPDYVAPEVLQYEPLSLLTDIWSVGVLAYVLLSGFSPFGGETKQETFLNISQCALTFPDKLFGGVSAAAIDFIRRALRIKPNDRMTAAGCLEHIWLKDECSIDRQIRTDISKPTTIDDDADEEEQLEDDTELDEEEEVDDDKSEAEIENAMSHDDADDNDDELNISATSKRVNGTTTNDSKMESSDVEEVPEDQAQSSKQTIMTNGKGEHSNSNGSSSSNGYSSYNGRGAGNRYASNNNSGYAAGAKYTNGGTKSTTNGKSAATTTTQRTTAIVTVPAMRATTIPLQYKAGHYQQQKQQHLQIPARRHSSSDSNKENTFLATKKIMPTATATAALVKKPLTATTTTTIIIGCNEVMDSGSATASTTTAGVVSSNVVSTFTLPSNGYNHGHNNSSNNNNNSSSHNNSANDSGSSNRISNEKYITSTHCLFPDAPTTPKVIRKAPNAEGSPTSVKALVKKFQLEGNTTTSPNGSEKHATATTTTSTHLKEAQATNQQTLAVRSASPQINGGSGSSSNSKKSSPMSNGVHKKYVGGEHSNNANHSTSNGRRASDPTTTVTHVAHNRSGSGGGATNYKTSCVLCISCGGSKVANGSTSTNGCRHSVDTTAGKVSKGSNNNTGSMNSTRNSSATTLVNGSTSTMTPSSSSTALLLDSPQKQQQQPHINGVHSHAHSHHHHHPHPHPHSHHHHHMHAVAVTKNVTANNLSLDQGIIC